MFGRSRPRWREVAEHGPRRSAREVLEFLHPDLCATLAGLHEAPQSVAEATVQLLPFGSRAALESLNPPLAIVGDPNDEEGHRALKLTPFAYEVMAAAATAADADPDAVSEWSKRAERARIAAEQASYRQP
jgi:hypothetical protein